MQDFNTNYTITILGAGITIVSVTVRAKKLMSARVDKAVKRALNDTD